MSGVHREPAMHEVVVRAPRGRSAVSPVRGRLAAWTARVRASTWSLVLAKVALGATALGVLAALGAASAVHAERSAVAAPEPPAPASAPVAAVASAPPSEVVADAGAAAPAGGEVLPDGRVVLNVASEESLRRLPGVGPARARAIVALRQRLGRLRAVEDLLRVKGIGRKMVVRIRPLVVLDAPIRVADAGPG